MHDLMFSKEIISAINRKIKTLANNEKISAVNVQLSPLSHVKPDTLIETFSLMIKDTPHNAIKLTIKKLGLGMRCRSCKYEFTAEEPTFKCPKCGSGDVGIVHNKEFAVDSFEICNNSVT